MDSIRQLHTKLVLIGTLHKKKLNMQIIFMHN